MVVIRLARGGAKKRPFYHIVAADKRNPRDGRNIEQLGYFNPVARGAETGLYIDLERIEYWKSVGAKLSDRIKFLLKKYQKQLLTKEQVVEKAAQEPVKTAEEPAVDTESKQEAAIQAHEQAQEETSTESQEETGSTDTTETQEQKSQTEVGEKS